ncbi:hypothetical protein PVAND_001743 [Polypedilum vanderplanki]|uniref:Uncharacterized protein n=1 Tax=Polypedilum vanderplanki TaxID=319348 RepID=A0A9J6BQ65_POLVA|nr:hypothetical protein PVAND_001743 [Polypedilum vanderplanki]
MEIIQGLFLVLGLALLLATCICCCACDSKKEKSTNELSNDVWNNTNMLSLTDSSIHALEMDIMETLNDKNDSANQNNDSIVINCSSDDYGNYDGND